MIRSRLYAEIMARNSRIRAMEDALSSERAALVEFVRKAADSVSDDERVLIGLLLEAVA